MFMAECFNFRIVSTVRIMKSHRSKLTKRRLHELRGMRLIVQLKRWSSDDT